MKDFREKVMDDVLDKYSAKTFKNRKEHILVKENDDDVLKIQANARTIPGIIESRPLIFLENPFKANTLPTKIIINSATSSKHTVKITGKPATANPKACAKSSTPSPRPTI